MRFGDSQAGKGAPRQAAHPGRYRLQRSRALGLDEQRLQWAADPPEQGLLPRIRRLRARDKLKFHPAEILGSLPASALPFYDPRKYSRRKRQILQYQAVPQLPG